MAEHWGASLVNSSSARAVYDKQTLCTTPSSMRLP
jgi:hypothetical protein